MSGFRSRRAFYELCVAEKVSGRQLCMERVLVSGAVGEVRAVCVGCRHIQETARDVRGMRLPDFPSR